MSKILIAALFGICSFAFVAAPGGIDLTSGKITVQSAFAKNGADDVLGGVDPQAPLIRRVRYGSRSKRRGSRYRQVAHVALKASSIDDRRLARSGRSKPCDSRSANSGNMGPSSSC